MADGFAPDASGKQTILKDPDAILDYTFDWTAWLAADTIIGVSFAVSNSVNANVVASSFDATHATAWVAGGQIGEKIILRCRIMTALGRTDDRTGYLKVKER